jgi:hypothetical protein
VIQEVKSLKMLRKLGIFHFPQMSTKVHGIASFEILFWQYYSFLSVIGGSVIVCGKMNNDCLSFDTAFCVIPHFRIFNTTFLAGLPTLAQSEMK